ncbi:toprim domain-containing protein [Terasakiella pusilla]|uniref:toprim domain-containing protein n=1 Tax=Terasakiella pusilla TaxID=64973 RepID=UPI003AA9D0B8
MKDILEIKAMLNDRVLSVCEYLLPMGKKDGNEWKAGSIYGDQGGSLGVHLKGNKTGVWADFATGDKGDLIGLWQACRGKTLPEALDDIRDYLGLEQPDFHSKPKTYNKPKKPQCNKPQGLVHAYLTEDRNIPIDVIDRYKVAEQGRNIVFPFLRDNELVMCKVREAVDGGKPKPTEAGCEKILFGWQAIDPNSRMLVITEGEIDAISGGAYGLPAVSVPFGGGSGDKQDWIENEYDRLMQFEDIYLALDNDQPGQEAAEEIVKRLGAARCHIVKLPRKDLNECLVDGISKDQIMDCLKNADTLKPDGLRHSNEFRDKVVDLFYPKGGELPGYTLPFAGYERKFRFRRGEMTIWTGMTGDGKSQTLSHVKVDLIRQGAKVCEASFEMSPEQNIKRMVRQSLNLKWDKDDPLATRPQKEQILSAFDWWEDQFYVFERVGKSNVDHMLSIFDYALRRYGCDTFIVDSLMRLGVGSEDYEGQEKAVYKLVNWAVENNVHVHLVAHARKTSNEKGYSRPPTMNDIKGSQEIGANSPNAISVWRNRELENILAKPFHARTESEKEKAGKPPVLFWVLKQRNGDWEGKIGLWFNNGSYQYRTAEDPPEGVHYASPPAANDPMMEGF